MCRVQNNYFIDTTEQTKKKQTNKQTNKQKQNKKDNKMKLHAPSLSF